MTTGLHSLAEVDYDLLDHLKARFRAEAERTPSELYGGFSFDVSSRGESVQIIDCPHFFFAHVIEALGTKIIVAQAMYRLTGETRWFKQVAQDTVAMVVNDLAVSGAAPLIFNLLFAIGSTRFFPDRACVDAFAEGIADACILAGCAWGGGETPELKIIISEEGVVAGGSSDGVIVPKSRRVHGNPRAGDLIVCLPSSGPHANAITNLRSIAAKLPEGYMEKIPGDGRSFGEAILAPTPIYPPLITAMLSAGVSLHAIIPITGHGITKMARSPATLKYRLTQLPPENAFFRFVREAGREYLDPSGYEPKKMWAAHNMGVGIAFIGLPSEIGSARSFLGTCGIPGVGAESHFLAGSVEPSPTRMVHLKHEGVTYKNDELPKLK